MKKEIFNYSRLGAIDTQKLAQLNMANAIKDAGNNEGLGGAGVGLGVGMGMGNMFTNMMGNNMQQGTATPPPILAFFIVKEGAQAGPFDMQQLQGMVNSGELTRQTLVWKAGMANWAAAEQQAELVQLFAAVPPPPPPVG